MNFFLNQALIPLNTAPMPQNIFLTIIEKHILIIWNMSYKSSSNSPPVQVLQQQIRGDGGSRPVLISLTQGGGPKFCKTCWCNTWTLTDLKAVVRWISTLALDPPPNQKSKISISFRPPTPLLTCLYNTYTLPNDLKVLMHTRSLTFGVSDSLNSQS